MTGQGRGRSERDGDVAEVEVRSVNHRGLKVVVRGADWTTPLEPRIESAIRGAVTRGTVTVQLRYVPATKATAVSIDTDTLQAYVDRLQSVRDTSVDSSLTLDLGQLLNLPGVVGNVRTDDVDRWPAIEAALHQAIEDHGRMRRTEGEAMAKTLSDEIDGIESRVDTIRQEAPRVTEEYARRLDTRIRGLMEKRGVAVDAVDLVREVAVFADRSDISEEVTRLDGHIALFRDEMASADGPVGRKLDFIVQEMFREANTTGSKAGSGDITAEVVEIKCALERIRELVQNIE